jgi:hypothetical protein
MLGKTENLSFYEVEIKMIFHYIVGAWLLKQMVW